MLNGDNCDKDCPVSHALRSGYGLSNVTERIAGREKEMIPVFLNTVILKNITGKKKVIVTVRDVSEIEKLKKEVNSRYQCLY